MHTLMIAYDNGGNAFYAGKAIDDNPYGATRINEWAEWRKGWIEAEKAKPCQSDHNDGKTIATILL